MPSYKYVARNVQTNQIVKSKLQASSQKDVYELLKKQGYVVSEINEENEKSEIFKSKRVKTKDRVLFARQLSTLINAGLPLVQALNSVIEQTTSKTLKQVITEVTKEVEGGKTFSKCLQKYPKVFNKIFINMIAAGEVSGTLDRSLDRLATQQEKDANIVSKIRGAMIYPALIVFVMIAVVSFMVVKVVPQISVLYTSFPGTKLPIETRILMSVANVIKSSWLIILLIFIAGIIVLLRWIKTESGNKFIDAVKLKTPAFGKLFQKLYMARFSRTSSTLLEAGVPLLQVLQITSESVSNYYVARSIRNASDQVRVGKSLGDTLKGDPYFLPLVPNVIKIGEESGTTSEMLAKSADFYEKEVEDTVANISSLIEPFMMILLGGVAIIIVLAVLLPIYGLAGSGAINSNG